MKEIEKYLFDLQGYIVLEGVLSEAEVARANEAVDRHADRIRERIGELSLSGDSAALKGITGRGDLGGLLGWEKPWCDPFREMLVHPRVVACLNVILGPGWRLDHNGGLISMRKGPRVISSTAPRAPASTATSTTTSRTARCTTA